MLKLIGIVAAFTLLAACTTDQVNQGIQISLGVGRSVSCALDGHVGALNTVDAAACIGLGGIPARAFPPTP